MFGCVFFCTQRKTSGKTRTTRGGARGVSTHNTQRPQKKKKDLMLFWGGKKTNTHRTQKKTKNKNVLRRNGPKRGVRGELEKKKKSKTTAGPKKTERWGGGL